MRIGGWWASVPVRGSFFGVIHAFALSILLTAYTGGAPVNVPISGAIYLGKDLDLASGTALSAFLARQSFAPSGEVEIYGMDPVCPGSPPYAASALIPFYFSEPVGLYQQRPASTILSHAGVGSASLSCKSEPAIPFYCGGTVLR